MDDVTIRRTDQQGRVVGFDRFIGLFTSKAYSEEAEHIPVLRAKLRELIQAEGLMPATHDYKALVAAFNSFPKEELFRAKTDELRKQLRLVLNVENESEVRLILEADPVRGNVIALVIMPRENFSAELRVRVQAALARALGGKLVYYYLALGESYTARLHFSFAAPPPSPSLTHELAIEIARLARTWEELLRERLQVKFGGARARELLARWMPAFASSYRSSTPPELAVEDIEHIDQLGGQVRFSVLIGPASGSADPDSSELRLYEFGEAPMLSELVPVLQNFGIAVLSESAHEFRLTQDGKPQPAYMQSFQVRTIDGKPLERMPGAALLGDALVAVRTGLAEDDALNALTLNAGLTWRETALLRAYLAAAFQMRLGPARPGLRRPFLQNPKLAGLLMRLFRRQFDPEKQTAPDDSEQIRKEYVEQLAAVENIADDRIARTLLAMVDATTRTNFFRDDATYIALKFESAKLPGLLDTAPLYEIHVNSPTMQGCHLRAGKIARGGIRYSDRFDDFRTEILGLMKTQTVKNAIIVPIGSKGGFIVKSGVGRVPSRAAVVEAYSILINAMLDLTDNLVDGEIVHPPRVVVRDTDGPYLVVAADKGTAAFSDIANNIAESRGFWLGDAFASGGEHGYDHKAMGITARGAWESAKRHLREMGRDLRRGAPITMVGIGDMSGDVFGNGLLQSDNVKLIAAFDHRHVFIDPSPDPLKSFAERERLYKMPNSSWADYDPSLISSGGGVFKRGQKSIKLSAEARAALDCPVEELDGERLVQTVLRAKVDLLYNGGIGTYVRADTETDAEVGDHANDSCRITASELRCKIAVEGGNLGFTQLARIEYALGGGRINTDAIDNSAGVDMSDHEVNLKILLQPIVASGGLTTAKRNRLLASVGNEVAVEVLRDNRDQALLLSLEQVRSHGDVDAFRDHLTAIERRGLIRQQESVLPTHAELSERHTRYPGLTRPELAVVTALTKIDLTARIVGSSLVEDPYLVERYLRPYFPAAIANEFGKEIPRFRLRRELLATQLVNELVDSMGSVFIFNLTRDFGLEIEQAVGAWLVASGVLDLHARAEDLHRNAENMSAEAELGAFLALEQPARRACAWAAIRPDQSSAIGETVTRLRPAFEQLLQQFETVLTDGEREQFERSYRDLRKTVHQEQLAHELARLSFAGHLLNVLNLSTAENIEPLKMARVYFGMSNRFEFATLESAIDHLNTEDRWERHAARDLRAELAWARNQLCCSIIDHPSNGSPLSSSQADPLRQKRLAEVERLMEELRALPAVGLPPLQVTVRALARLASGI